MKLFLKIKSFKIFVIIFAVLFVLFGVSYGIGKTISPQSSFFGALVTPVQRGFSAVSEGINDFFTSFDRAGRLEQENNELREEIRGLKDNVVDLDKYKNENEFYKSFLELKEKNKDFKFESSTVIASENINSEGTFVVNSGSLRDVAVNDPVITADGLVGSICEVYPTYSVVKTLICHDFNVGVTDSRTAEPGIVGGNDELSKQGKTRLSYLSRNSTVASGDYIITSGTGGIFPEGLMVGTVEEVGTETGGVSLYATVKPAVTLSDVTQVMIITEFEGQGISEQK